MIVRESGVLKLADETVGPTRFVAGAPPGRGWQGGAGGVWVREASDPRDRSLVITAWLTAGRLVCLELCYAVRRPAEGLEGPIAWETARKDYHDAIVREWFASSVHDLMYAPPPQPGPLRYTFAWGTVRSDLRSDARGARIEIRYEGTVD